MKHSNFKRAAIFYRSETAKGRAWNKKITAWLQENYPQIKILNSEKPPKNKKTAPDLVIALGGDGTILEAARRYHTYNSLIIGLNLGRIGFLASIRKEENFLSGLGLMLKGKYKADPRLMISAALYRKNKTVVKLRAVNDVSVQNLSGLVQLKISVKGHPLQNINGSGVLVATATGSTAYNLSLHGPIVMPNIRCFIITEISDHNIPTPSVVIKRDETIVIDVEDFRKQNKFIIAKTGKKTDVILTIDGFEIIPLQKGDKIIIQESQHAIHFAELDKNYFFKSLQEKFAFK
ncbi:MAG: hypothetical protein A3I89_00045 [Candidatus Harrisonbacteria bacterium RIFCSPLOWO2_02_FULL_41_11]|uniref:NAD kinase n=1 Tax=Candidatus Harrisonbacteria bacterium RIFCSPHIGHO2_02_FULL_42_16 TaxID=1798404 RepID=A0A1G1ZFE4_9BACT|nr:MAG: hypothetical protein A3B92_03490 [Candidatus Harrisonbacteria bacterium RIFCSPHIGHO2_02_FULL_42_16]OGY66801.1 MAG: hypothetical protein A3I89_00045 [Candidatus Harrisonbacteria bacterium RIFCSPLOWO2_02_FULL_41_11]